jgi:hypothetical protein
VRKRRKERLHNRWRPPSSVDDIGVALVALSGHKFYATKDIGVLYVRNNTSIQSVLVGAGHEASLWPGTSGKRMTGASIHVNSVFNFIPSRCVS